MAEDMNLQIVLESVNESTAAFDTVSQSLSEISRLTDELAKAFDSFGKGAQTAMQQASSAVDTLSSPLDNDQKGLSDLSKAFEDIGKTADTASQTAVQALNSIDTPLKDQTKAAEDAAKAMELIGKNAEDAGKAVVSSMGEATKATEEEAGAGGKGSGGGGSGGHGKNEGGLFGMQGQMDTMYAGMTMGAAALPIDAAFKSAVDTFGTFDQAVANVNSMMGESADGVANLKQQLIDLSPEVNSGPTELAQALYGIVGAGVPAAQAMDVLKTSAEAAKAGQTDVATASNAIIAVMDSYGVSADKAGQIADQMFAANASGAMTFDSFARSIGNVAGPAAQTGVSFDQVASATAALTNQGMSAQRATQGLRALMVGIAAPTNEAQKEAKKLGIEWDSNALKSKGLVGMMQEAMQATGGNTEELKKLIPNIAAWTVATDLGGKGADSYKQAMDAMAQSSGATGRALTAQEQGFTEQVNAMKGAIETAQITFVTSFAPAITYVANLVTELANWFSHLSEGTQHTIAVIAAAAAGFLTFGSMIFLAISGFGSFISGMLAISKAFGLVEESAKALDLMKLLVNPWGLAIGAAILIIYEIVTHWDQIKNFLEATWHAIENTATAVWNGIKSFFAKWGLDIIAALIGPVALLALEIYKHWDQIRATTERVWNTLIREVRQIWDGFTKWISTAAHAAVQWIVDAFDWMYNHNYYFKDLVDFITKAWNTLKDASETIWNAIKDFFSKLWDDLTSLTQTAWNALQDFFSDIWNAIVAVADAIWTPIKDFFSALWDDLSSAFSVAWNGITDVLSGLWNGAVDDAKSIFNGLETFFTGLWDKARSWGSNLVHMVAQGITDAAEEVAQAAENVAKKITGFLGFHSPTEEGPGSDADTWMPNMMNMFIQGIQQHIPALQDTLNQALGSPFGMSGLAVSQNVSTAFAGGYGGRGTSQGNTINITVQGHVLHERELVDMVSKGQWDKMKMQGKF